MAVPGPPLRRHSARLHEAAKAAKVKSASKSSSAPVVPVVPVAGNAGKAKAGRRLVASRRLEPSPPKRGPKLAKRSKREEAEGEEEDGGDEDGSASEESEDVYPRRPGKNARRQVAAAKGKAAAAKAKVAKKAASKRPVRTKMAEASKPLKRSGTDSREAEAPAEPPVAQQELVTFRQVVLVL